MKIMKTMYEISKHQPTLVLMVAAAYLSVPIVGKMLCGGINTVGQNYLPGYYATPFCSQPQEIGIPLAFVYGTSGDSETFTIMLS